VNSFSGFRRKSGTSISSSIGGTCRRWARKVIPRERDSEDKRSLRTLIAKSWKGFPDRKSNVLEQVITIAAVVRVAAGDSKQRRTIR
jgi:hypothetical protein